MEWKVFTPDNPPDLPAETKLGQPWRGPYYWGFAVGLANWSFFWSVMIRRAESNPTRPIWATCYKKIVYYESSTRYWSAWNWRKGTWGRWRKGTPKIFTG